jgi:hypothetical protein
VIESPKAQTTIVSGEATTSTAVKKNQDAVVNSYANPSTSFV